MGIAAFRWSDSDKTAFNKSFSLLQAIGLIWTARFAAGAYYTQGEQLQYERDRDETRELARQLGLVEAMLVEADKLLQVLGEVRDDARGTQPLGRLATPLIDRGRDAADAFPVKTVRCMARVVGDLAELRECIDKHYQQYLENLSPLRAQLRTEDPEFKNAEQEDIRRLATNAFAAMVALGKVLRELREGGDSTRLAADD